VVDEPWHVRCGRAATRLVRTPSGWIHVHLAQTGSGRLSQFDDQGRLLDTEQVWWDEELHPRFLDVDLTSGLASLGLKREDAEAVTAELRADVEPLRIPPFSRLDTLKFYVTFFPMVVGGWALALALLIWVLVTQVV
jgi:hypothetical protein